jgi:phage portal protein BeeE
VPGLLERIAQRREQKSFVQPPFWQADDLRYGLLSWAPPLGREERIENDYAGLIGAAYKANGIVFACMLLRMSVLSEARFLWRTFRNGRPQPMFGHDTLALLEEPWPSGQTGDLIVRMEVVSVLAGNWYATLADERGRVGREARGDLRIAEMRPDWVKIVISSRSGDPRALDARVVGYSYEPPPLGDGSGVSSSVLLTPSEVVHFAPVPDPDHRIIGMSPLSPLLEEIRSDKLATTHKAKFFENGASPQFVVLSKEASSSPRFDALIRKYKEHHRGADKAYETLFLADGADIRPLGVDLRQLDFKATQGAGETRIAAGLGVHPTIVALSEGMAGSSLNTGNFNAAAQIVGKRTFKPWWRRAAGALQTIVPKPPTTPSASLWYDDRDVAFLKEEETAAAEIRQKNAATLQTLFNAGWDPDAAIRYAQTNELEQLIGKHSGLTSVQVQQALAAQQGGETAEGEGESSSAAGNGKPRAPAGRER